MKKIALFAVAVALGALSTLAFARDVDGPFRVVFTDTTESAIKTSLKKSGDHYWKSKQLARPFNRLAQQGFHVVHVLPAGNRLVIIAKKR